MPEDERIMKGVMPAIIMYIGKKNMVSDITEFSIYPQYPPIKNENIFSILCKCASKNAENITLKMANVIFVAMFTILCL